ncbi:MAG TPA: L,D-transpeptidase family protein [Solirubrobacteraceae bacterium]|nr:L,D-transpeptidase family protein [Solirubrobacteraceae bacterium]
MSLRLLIALSCLLAGPATVPAHAQEQPPPEGSLESRQIIAPGVKAGGIDLGGQSVEQAAQTLELSLRELVQRPVLVKSGGREFTLTAEEAKVRFNPMRTAKRAYYAGRDQGPNVEVPLALRHDEKAVRAFAERVDAEVARKPKNASVRIELTDVFLRKGKRGRTINEHKLARAIDKALADPVLPRELRAKLNPDLPDTTTREVRRAYRTIVTVDRTGLKLRLFKRLKHRKTYGIAIGMAGFDTPSGLFNIQSKQVDPPWHAPNRPWAGGYAGQTIPGGAPNNPLKARWLGVNGSVGIHGTAEEWSIGTRASHGCIRMRVPDVIELYRRVPLGTPVLIR